MIRVIESPINWAFSTAWELLKLVFMCCFHFSINQEIFIEHILGIVLNAGKITSNTSEELIFHGGNNKHKQVNKLLIWRSDAHCGQSKIASCGQRVAADCTLVVCLCVAQGRTLGEVTLELRPEI